MTAKTFEFWFDLASTYSYLTAMRIETLAADAGVTVSWQPFLLGPIFQAQGWNTSPFNLVPAKGRYMVRDIERIASLRGLNFRMPQPFPQSSIVAARIALVALEEGWGASLVKAIYAAEFGAGESIAETSTLSRIITAQGHDSARVLARCGDADIKQHLRDQTTAAQAHGIFGAPTLRTRDGDLFWGDDRLELAVSHAQQL